MAGKGKPGPTESWFRGWTRERVEKLERDSAELERIKTGLMLRDFIEELGNAVLTVLATKSYSKWPLEAKIAMEHVSRVGAGMQSAAAAYRRLLPEEKDAVNRRRVAAGLYPKPPAADATELPHSCTGSSAGIRPDST